MDWLEQHNPAIDWISKKLSFHLNGESISLQGQQVQANRCKAVTQLQLQQMLVANEVEHVVFLCESSDDTTTIQSVPARDKIVPPAVQAIVDDFAALFVGDMP